jgi:multiple RNA-binding domain-containing protein 1
VEGNDDFMAAKSSLFVQNLPIYITREQLIEKFSVKGKITDMKLMSTRDGKCRQLAFVSFETSVQADDVLRYFDRTFIGCTRIMVKCHRHHMTQITNYFKNTKAVTHKPKHEISNSFRGDKMVVREKIAEDTQGDRSAWSSLFMRKETVIEAITSHYCINKSEMLERSSSTAGRRCLGETWVIAETKRCLIEAHVDTTKLERAAYNTTSSNVPHTLSDSVILVRNLPYVVTEKDLTQVFGRLGLISRLILPLTKTLALIEYSEPRDAQAAKNTGVFQIAKRSPVS